VSKAKLAIALSALTVAIVTWAIPGKGIAHQRVQRQRADVVAPVRLKDERERGLLAQGWVNGAGPFVFVIDTGAGVSLINRNIVEQARLQVTRSRRTLVGGFSTAPIASDQETRVSGLALGQRGQGEPLSSEDTALLLAVGSHVATALDNGRLYRQLQLKASELQRLQQFNENIVESLDNGLVVEDLNGRVIRWNRALESIYGISSAEATGHRLEEVFDGPFIEGLRAAQRESANGASLFRVPLAGRAGKAGERLRVNIATVPLRAPIGQANVSTVGNIIIIEDVTERVHLEEQLQISDKMASVGLLAAGVAHEVNTPLTGISSFTQMLLSNADPEDPKTRMLEKIEQQTFRAAKIVNGLLNLSRSGGSSSEENAPVDLNAVISDVLSLLEPQVAASKVKVRRELCPTPALVVGVEHKLQQVFLNLFLNARDAMPKGGWLSVETRLEDGQVVAEVADTGSGIPSEHLSRIYDPFFTTKLIGKGTGLGLSITYGIVREHEGAIDCESTPGQGTRFTVSLPAVLQQRSIAVRQRN